MREDRDGKRDFLSFFRVHILGDLLEIKYIKNNAKLSLRGDWGCGKPSSVAIHPKTIIRPLC